jgi:hypothetical protein
MKYTIPCTLLMLMALTSLCYSAEPLNKAVGKLFDVNPATKTARFLKQDVTIDPKTGARTPWYTIHFTEKTTLTRLQGVRSFHNMNKPMIVDFKKFDDKNWQLMKEGKGFMCELAEVRPDMKEPTGINEDTKSVMGWFQARIGGRFVRNGVLKLNGKEIPAQVRSHSTRIFIKEVVTPEQLAKGSWKATLSGNMVDGKFVVDNMGLNRLDDRLATDDPKLPRVLSVGDSISMNYYKSTKEGLKGIANYHKIEDNCWSVYRGMTFISYWLGDYKAKGRRWDVVLVNSGMHDMKQKKLRGPYAVPLEKYKKGLEKEIQIIKETGATVIFVTTTPVQNDSGNKRYAFRSKGAEKDFNQAAKQMLKAHPDVHILDLAKVVNESKVLDNWRKGTEIHYWKAHESAVLGKAVTEKIKEVLAAKKAK